MKKVLFLDIDADDFGDYQINTGEKVFGKRTFTEYTGQSFGEYLWPV